MKHILSKISLVLALFGTSCSDFLDERPTGTLSSTSNLSSADAAVAFANGAYVNATVFNSLTAGWGSATPLLLEYMTGKASSENSQSNFKEFQELTVSSRSPYIEEWWRGCYAGIANCNLAMQKLPEFTQIDPNLISRYQGEVLFMRAMYYFYLVRIFGDVPKIKTSQTELTELLAARSPIKEIYDEIIIPDLLAAEKSALPVKDVTGRVSMSAVKALLADVYLSYAGYPVKGGDQYYAESAKRSLEVLKQYTLFGKYEDLWNPANNNKGEFIFQIQFSLNKSTNQMVNIPLPSRSGMSAFNLEYGSLIPTKEFVESYREGDLRSEEKKFFFSTYKGNKSKFSAGAPELEFMDFKGYYIHKFFDAGAIDVAGQSGLNWTIYRLPDVMLMYAEAQNEADGSPNAASLEALNAVRKRAGLAAFQGSDPAAFRTAVWDERYFELSYENKMWFDMIRTRKIRNDLTGRYVDFTGYTTKWGKTYTDTQLLFPIPLREMQTNPKLIQNSGY